MFMSRKNGGSLEDQLKAPSEMMAMLLLGSIVSSIVSSFSSSLFKNLFILFKHEMRSPKWFFSGVGFKGMNLISETLVIRTHGMRTPSMVIGNLQGDNVKQVEMHWKPHIRLKKNEMV